MSGLAGRTAIVTGAAQGIAPAVAFLASEEAGWVTGSTVNVDGGHVRH